jgi:hypothetical protein
VNLLKHLEGNGWQIQTAIQTTFPFEPDFYSRYVASRLARRNCSTPLVLVDGNRYEEKIADEWASAPIGDEYFIEPVYSPGVFHPKINLYASDHSVYFTVSSANLTLSEYCDAVQIGQSGGLQQSWLDDDDRALGDVPGIAREIRDYISELSETPWVTGSEARNYIAETVERLDWLDDLETTSRSTWFLSNLDEPIIDQLGSQIGDVDRLQMYAPFWGTPSVMQQLIDRIDPASVEFVVEDKNTNLQTEALSSAIDPAFRLRKLEHDTARWIHAKVLVVEGAWGSACLFGSPNMTGAALLKEAVDGNVEAGLLRVEDDPDYFDLVDRPADADGSVLGDGEFEFTVSDAVEAEEITQRERDYEGWSRGSSAPDIQLLDVRLSAADESGESTLHLSIGGVSGEVTIEVAAVGGSVRKQARTAIDDGNSSLTFTIPGSERSEWVAASVQAHVLEQDLVSNTRRVTPETQEYYTQSRQMLESSGRAGADELINAVLFDGEVTAANVLYEVYSRLDERRGSRAGADGSGKQSSSDTDSGTTDTGEITVQVVDTSNTRQISTKKLVEQILEFHREQAQLVLDTEDPGMDDLTAFVEHGDAFWELIELCLLSDYLGLVDDSGIVDACEGELEKLRSDDLLTHLRRSTNSVINRLDSEQGTSTVEELESAAIWRDIYRVFFVHPVFVLELQHWREEYLLDPRWLLQAVHEAFDDLNDYAAQYLLETDVTVAETQKIYDSIKASFSEYEDELPGIGEDPLAVATFTLLFEKGEEEIREIAQDSELSIEQKSSLGGWASRGQELLQEYDMKSLHLLLITPGQSSIKQAFEELGED